MLADDNLSDLEEAFYGCSEATSTSRIAIDILLVQCRAELGDSSAGFSLRGA